MTQDERDGVIEEAMDVCAEVRDGEPPQSWPKDYAEGFKAGADNCVSMIFNTLSHGRGRKSPTPNNAPLTIERSDGSLTLTEHGSKVVDEALRKSSELLYELPLPDNAQQGGSGDASYEKIYKVICSGYCLPDGRTFFLDAMAAGSIIQRLELQGWSISQNTNVSGAKSDASGSRSEQTAPTPQHGDREDALKRELAEARQELAKRLRRYVNAHPRMNDGHRLMIEAAVEIERLQSLLSSPVGDEAGVLPKLAAAHQAIDQGSIADAKRLIAEASETVAAMKRLVAVDEEMVERAAIAFSQECDRLAIMDGVEKIMPWAEMSEKGKQNFRITVRAALQAALCPLPTPPQPAIGKGEG